MERIHNEKEALAAVRKHGWMLEYVPENFKTAKVCLAAVRECGWALQHVPEELKEEELCSAVLSYIGMALEYMLDEHKTAEICLAAVQDHGWALKCVYGTPTLKYFNISVTPQNMLFVVRRENCLDLPRTCKILSFRGIIAHFLSMSLYHVMQCH